MNVMMERGRKETDFLISAKEKMKGKRERKRGGKETGRKREGKEMGRKRGKKKHHQWLREKEREKMRKRKFERGRGERNEIHVTFSLKEREEEREKKREEEEEERVIVEESLNEVREECTLIFFPFSCQKITLQSNSNMTRKRRANVPRESDMNGKRKKEREREIEREGNREEGSNVRLSFISPSFSFLFILPFIKMSHRKRDQKRERTIS